VILTTFGRFPARMTEKTVILTTFGRFSARIVEKKVKRAAFYQKPLVVFGSKIAIIFDFFGRLDRK